MITTITYFSLFIIIIEFLWNSILNYMANTSIETVKDSKIQIGINYL